MGLFHHEEEPCRAQGQVRPVLRLVPRQDTAQELKKTHVVMQLFENVVPSPKIPDADKHFNHRIGCEAIIMDAADDKIIKRLRLWWATVDWYKADKLLQDKLNARLKW